MQIVFEGYEKTCRDVSHISREFETINPIQVYQQVLEACVTE